MVKKTQEELEQQAIQRSEERNNLAERASVEEVKEFVNIVRKAGGEEILDALLPSIPTDAEACLIARNFNFNCTVEPDWNFDPDKSEKYGYEDWETEWQVIIPNKEKAQNIADALGIPSEDCIFDEPEVEEADLKEAIEERGWTIDDFSPTELYGYGIIPLEARFGRVAEAFDLTSDVPGYAPELDSLIES